MKHANILLALENELLRQELVYLLRNGEASYAVKEEDPGNWRALIGSLQADKPEVLLLELAAVTTELTSAIREIKRSAPRTKIVALHSSDDPKAILTAMRAGVNEFVHPPFEDTVALAIERVMDAQEDDARGDKRGRVVGFLSAKGGCGATTLACHIAADLKRQDTKKVLLADLDLTSGMVGFHMKVASSYSILDAITNLSRLDTSLWKALLAEWKPGLEVIPSPDDFSHESAPGREELRQLVRFMRTQHDWIVLDLGRSYNELVAALYEELDDLLLVSVLEVSALHGLKTIAQKLRDRNEDLTKLHVVLNRTPKMMDITQDELQKVLGRPLYATLPNDYPSLYQAYSQGQLLPPSNRLAQQFSVLTRKLAGVEAAKKTEKKKFSLFR
jgi:pilus assembly protein CpaE